MLLKQSTLRRPIFVVAVTLAWSSSFVVWAEDRAKLHAALANEVERQFSTKEAKLLGAAELEPFKLAIVAALGKGDAAGIGKVPVPTGWPALRVFKETLESNLKGAARPLPSSFTEAPSDLLAGYVPISLPEEIVDAYDDVAAENLTQVLAWIGAAVENIDRWVKMPNSGEWFLGQACYSADYLFKHPSLQRRLKPAHYRTILDLAFRAEDQTAEIPATKEFERIRSQLKQVAYPELKQLLGSVATENEAISSAVLESKVRLSLKRLKRSHPDVYMTIIISPIWSDLVSKEDGGLDTRIERLENQFIPGSAQSEESKSSDLLRMELSYLNNLLKQGSRHTAALADIKERIAPRFLSGSLESCCGGVK